MRRLIIHTLLISMAFFLPACSSGAPVTSEVYSLKVENCDAVAADMLVDIYEEATLHSVRITQALYNQPLRIIGETNGFYEAETAAGIKGFMLKSKVIPDTASLMTNAEDEKILVTGETKTIYAKPDGKVPVGRVVTGTELSYRGKEGDWVRILLCDGREGYLTINNIILYSKAVPITDVSSFLRDIRTNIGSKYLKGGASAAEGFDMPNLVYICAKINGIMVPPDLELAGVSGTSVDKEEMSAGDIIFLAKDRYNDIVDDVAVVLDNDSVAVLSKKEMVIEVARMAETDIRNRTVKVIRLFGEDG